MFYCIELFDQWFAQAFAALSDVTHHYHDDQAARRPHRDKDKLLLLLLRNNLNNNNNNLSLSFSSRQFNIVHGITKQPTKNMFFNVLN